MGWAKGTGAAKEEEKEQQKGNKGYEVLRDGDANEMSVRVIGLDLRGEEEQGQEEEGHDHADFECVERAEGSKAVWHVKSPSSSSSSTSLLVWITTAAASLSIFTFWVLKGAIVLVQR